MHAVKTHADAKLEYNKGAITMAKSKAQKVRAHAVRNGKRNPTDNRAFESGFSTHVRKTPTLQEQRLKQEQKYKQKVVSYG